MGFLKKSKKSNKGLAMAVNSLMSTRDMMVAKGFYDSQVTARCATVENILEIGKAKLDQDMHNHYQGEVERIKARAKAFYKNEFDKQLAALNEQLREREQEVWDKANAYERHCRVDYDEHMKQSKTQLKYEVFGDFIAMTTWVLRDYFEMSNEDLHTYILQLLRLEATINESMEDDSKIERFTINDIANKMKNEGYDITDDIVLVEEMVNAEMERFERPYVPAGSVMDKWTESEDERLKRLVIEQRRDYPEISLVLQRSENACKGRVRKLFGTSVLTKIWEDAA